MSAECLNALIEAHARQTPVVWTSLVETRGSSPQKAGASMLVFGEGSQVGTLGGGCVEAEVKRKALQNLQTGQREIVTFQLDNNYGWDDGLICGGRMTMLIDPVLPDEPTEQFAYFETLQQTERQGDFFTETILLEDQLEDSGRAGDRTLLDESGATLASRGSGQLTPMIAENLKPSVDRPRPYVTQKIAYLPHLNRCRLLIVGAGHIGQKVAELANDVDFDVWVLDDREQYCNLDRFPTAKRLIVDTFDVALKRLEIDEHTFVIIVTRGHNHDEEALFHLTKSRARYLGMIGSRRKIKLIMEDLLSEGVSPEVLSSVYAPLGFDIGSQTVSEIAISILAELIAVRNLGGLPESIRLPSFVDKLKTETA
ncbi:putative xanthine dehydrogenase subunit A [Polystyrenella longa]|uniref:Putative xanthine dehydrogenase subunit A n=1 Tax=Polystyrenella longa TaxID=2528007 RepID=A0A518CII8_9PLAN|nr:XdhC/CoxI family protein [Polystyrenella longa]QDU79048.1 putative xanthine dehydrogenase subunit A [Polystyrenella longa]